MEKQSHKLRVREIIRKAWKTFREAPGFYIGLTLMFLITSIILDGLGNMTEDTLPSILFAVATFLITALIQIVLLKAAIKHVRGEKPSFKKLFDFTTKEFSVYAIVAIAVTALSSLGFILLIVPGIIISLMLAFAGMIVIDGERSVKAALKKSKALTSGHKWKLFLLMLVMIPLNLLGFLALGVGVIVTASISLIAMVHAYEFLLKKA